jgi:archaellum component FlaC
MTFEDRLDRLTERHEALTQTVELLAMETRELAAETRELKSAIAQDAENIRALARIAEIHERRITHLENGPQ